MSFLNWAGGPPDGAACVEFSDLPDAPSCPDFWGWVHTFPGWWFPTIAAVIIAAAVFIIAAAAWYWLDERLKRPDPSN